MVCFYAYMAEKNIYFVTNLLRNILVDIHSITLAMGLLHTYLQVLLEYYCLHKNSDIMSYLKAV